MNAKNLIRVLQGLDPDCNISLSLGRDDDYRNKCAKAELTIGDCLGYLDVDKIEIYNAEDNGMWVDIVLKQDGIIHLEDEAAKFDEMYSECKD